MYTCKVQLTIALRRFYMMKSQTSSAIPPRNGNSLAEESKLAWLLMVNHFRDPQDPSKYQDIDHIHLDEKWFFLT